MATIGDLWVNINAKTDNFEKGIGKAESKANSLGTVIGKVAQNIASFMIYDVGKNLVNINAKTDNFEKGIGKAESKANSLGTVIGKVAQNIASFMIYDVGKNLVTGFTNAAKAGIDYNATLETSSIKWETLLGSQEKANKMLKDIEKFAATTPFEKMGVEAMATQLHNAGFEGQSPKAGIDYNATLETSSIKWETLLGSQEKANKMLKDIEKFAATTPFEKMGVEAMSTQLHNAGFRGQELFDQLTKFGDLSGAFGIQADSLQEMVRQYAQVKQAGVAYTEDLNILQDRGMI